MKGTFDYKAAREAGYNDEQIEPFLSEMYPNFDFKAARESGHSLEDINSFVSTNLTSSLSKPEQEIQETRSPIEKGLRAAGQFGLGLLEATPSAFVYDVAVAPLASQEAQLVNYRQLQGEEIEQLLEKKSMAPNEWTEDDQKFLDNAINQLKNPEEALKNVQTADLSLRSLIEKSTGINLQPEGILEKAAHWTGFIKDPKKLFELGKTGLKSVDLIKAIAPSGKEALRGAGAGVALELAERGNFGPIGTMAAAVLGDVSGNLAAMGGNAIKQILTNPRETLAQVAKFFTNKDKLQIQKDLIKDFRDANLQADIGTITDNNLIKWVQSRLAQSGLTGNGIDELKKTLTNQIKTEYKTLADSLGEAKYATSHEAGEVMQNALKSIRDKEKQEAQNLYKNAINDVGEAATVNPSRIISKIEEIEKSLKPGQLKSAEQSKVLEILEPLKRDVQDANGDLMYAKVKDLINDKIALNDIINYETQGGAKQLLKGVVAELDRAIISYGRERPSFGKNYINANKKFSNHAKTFRNKNISQMLTKYDPEKLMNSMNNVKGIKDLRYILNKTPEGKKIFDSLARLKFDQVVGDNMIDSTTQQIKLGTFSKLLEKSNRKDLIKELIPAQSYKNLQRLQGLSGKLADSAQKFFNASKSGITLEDAGVVSKVLVDLGNLLGGNPWPIVKTGLGISGARYLTNLISNPEFLKMVEDLILASEKNNAPMIAEIGKMMVSPIKAALNEEVR